MKIYFAVLGKKLDLSTFPYFLHSGGPCHCPFFHTSALGFDVSFGQVPQIPNPCQWPVEHPASACACAHLQVLGSFFPPLTETWIYCSSCSSFVCHSFAETSHQMKSSSVGWRTWDEAAWRQGCGILYSCSSHGYFGGLLVASQQDWETKGELQCSWKNLDIVVYLQLLERSKSLSWWVRRHSHPCWAHRGIAGNLWLTSVQEQ